MNSKYRLIQALLVCMFIPAASTIVYPREPGAPAGTVVFQRQVQGPETAPLPPIPGDNTFYFVSSEFSFDGKLVKGAPYSAQALTETIQVLGDGNRIVNKSTASVYRDSEGRTRREQSLRAIGPFANANEPQTSIVINDPVSGNSYVLDDRNHSARKMAMRRFEFKVPAPGEPGDKAPTIAVAQATTKARTAPDSTSDVIINMLPGTGGWATTGIRTEYQASTATARKANVESLGKQNIEGVEAEGTRTTFTIPAGEIGNERPIDVVNERWYSPALQTVVMTKHSDPRFGETTYRLTNIDRSEPPASLFEVPADYNIIKGGPGIGFGEGGGIGVGVGGGVGGGVSLDAKAISGGVLNSKAITLPKPEYPTIAREAHASGSVAVQVTIDEEGNVTAAKAVSGHPLLQAAAVDAARQAKFPPTKLEGRGVKVNGVVTYTFTYNSDKSPE